MNIPNRWQESRLEDGSVRFTSEHTFNGPIVVTARLDDGKVVWDNPNDVPHFINERANALLVA
jgi:hypothetical protein